MNVIEDSIYGMSEADEDDSNHTSIVQILLQKHLLFLTMFQDVDGRRFLAIPHDIKYLVLCHQEASILYCLLLVGAIEYMSFIRVHSVLATC
jgi:hypothetical protein